MARIEIRFYAELNDFLPPARRACTFTHVTAPRTPLKDVIEGLGVPHPEVDLVLANGCSVDLGYLPQEGDRIAVYPVFEAFDISALTRIRPEPLRQVRFVLDVHLGRLVALLRMAGFDSMYSTDASDSALADTAWRERRILLTRDQALLKRRVVTHGYYVRSLHPPTQFTEVMRRFDAWALAHPFTRCLRCNTPLSGASPEAIAELAPPRVRARHDEFSSCPGCGRLYWKGSHYARMLRLLERAREGHGA